MPKDLRTWLRSVEKLGAGELRRVTKRVDPKFEASALMERLERGKLYPTVLFENVVDVEERTTSMRIIFNCFANMAKIGAALGVDGEKREELYNEFTKRMSNSIDVLLIDENEAPIYSHSLLGSQVDLNILPIPRVSALDGGHYLTPLVITKVPGGRYNLSFNRCMLLDHNHLAIYMSPRHLWQYTREAEERGEDLSVALVLGHHPALYLSGAALVGLDKDEYRVAASILGESIRVVPSKTLGEDFFIPADAEAVLEGKIKALKRTVEGPFGEFTGYIGSQRLSWLVEITAVHHRPDAIILQVFSSHRDNMYAHFPLQASIFAHLKNMFPNVKDIAWVETGGPLHMVISMEKRTEGEPLRAAMAAMSMSNFIKHVIIVDEDIDVTDNEKIMWAIATRVQADRDVKIIEGIQGQLLDPSLPDEIRGSGMIIDATKPKGKIFPPIAQPPEEVVRKINITEYFDL
ncbi:UbiD decarboxylyase family [Moorella glycerini]|uniref:Phenolic acid decarboxylase subunit C n=1 Tax=Neomoorella stamsii TaxID=1266720 RepID=A0A9X7J3V2_9FIRM|nr:MULTISPECIES: UbiD family decarboxylase [Moorella]PRR73425.1 Phenolic acid decarboxylase subunit C [Moorella stamsii]CEP69194.1 UbiD decarboxylyase family [Moorella glycerini]